MKKCCLTIAMVICSVLGIMNVLTTLVTLFVDFGFAIGSGLSAALYLFIAKKLYEKINKNKVKETKESVHEIKEEKHNNEKAEKIGEILGKILGYAICAGMVVGGIALVILVFKLGFSILVWLVQIIFGGFMYIIGAILGLWVIYSFIGYWWRLVKWEHVVYPRIRRRRRR